MNDPDAQGDGASGPGDGPTLAAAWDHFYAYCSTIIGRVPGGRSLSAADREDCVQEVMFELVRRFGDHPEVLKENLDGWIRVVARHKAVDLIRRRVRKAEVGLDDGDGDGGDWIEDEAPEPAADRERGETVSLVWEALLSLDHEVPVTSYLVFYLRTIEGWEVAEIAELFQISEEQARARCHRVKKKFGSILARQEGRSGRAG